MMAAERDTNVDGRPEWAVDGLARLSGLPVRTIREYQTLGLLPPPQKRGRIGFYSPTHLSRLQLIGRLQERGYSLAGIRDLLQSWRDGADLGEVLGLSPDQLVHVDEPGVAAGLAQLTAFVPGLVPERIGDLLAAGVLQACDDHYCVPSPSLLQLAADALAAGVAPDGVIELLSAIGAAASSVADTAVQVLARMPASADQDAVALLVTKGRGLLGHGTGRLTIYNLGQRLGVGDEADATTAVMSRLARGGR